MLLQAFTGSSTLGMLLDLFIFLVAWAHVLIAPYTKVEESFNLHATHDILAYGVTPSALPNYDHFVFPGVVPRTFIGSLALATASYIPLRIFATLGLIRSKLGAQVLVRIILASVNAFGLSRIRWAVQRRFGAATSALFVILTCTQFHLPFWIGRTLPNMFALLPVNLATSLLVNPGATRITTHRHYRVILCMIGSAAIIFRSELVLLAIPTFAIVLFQHRVPLSFLMPMGAGFAIGSMASTVLVDSYFWNAWNPPLWPELSGILFNVYEGKSSEWGTSPYHAYLIHHLPKLLLASAPLAAFACIPSQVVARACSLFGASNDSKSDDKTGPAPSPNWHLDAAASRTCQQLLVAPIAFVLLISGLGHKEWRFVVYVVPIVNVVAAIGASRLLSLPSKPLWVLSRLVLLGLVAGNVVATIVLTAISRANYPGGLALEMVNSQQTRQASVYIDNLAAQTGASLFTQDRSPPYFFSRPSNASEWTYSKDPSPPSYTAFTYLVTEDASAYPREEWETVGSVDAFDRVDVRRVLNALVTKPTLFILRNKNLM